MTPDALRSEARARIIWGESSLSVHGFLTTNGLSDSDADVVIDQCIAERNLTIRRIGIKRTIIGSFLTLGACLFLYLSLKHADIQKMSSMDARGFVMVAGLVAVGGFYGLWKLMDGITYLCRPQSEHKAIPDMLE